jgi:SAM-dependent methyltransferase
MAAQTQMTASTLDPNATPPAQLIREAVEERHARLAPLPHTVVRRAWMLAAHLLLPAGARVAVMGCGNGAVAYALAALRPGLRILAADPDRRAIARAKTLYRAPNLRYAVGDGPGALEPPFAAGALDAVMADGTLHRAYTDGHYASGAVVRLLAGHMALLREGGLLLTHDYLAPAEGFVVVDLPDLPSDAAAGAAGLSDADFLEWFAAHAHPEGGDAACAGFFLEELPPRAQGRRAFRLPAKWAAEFLIRRALGQEAIAARTDDVATEYAPCTGPELRMQLEAMGARVLYTAPQWPPLAEVDEGPLACLLFTEGGAPLPHPPRSFVAVAQRAPERTSLAISERRPAPEPAAPAVAVRAMRNSKTGALIDVASRGVEEVHEVMPWRVDSDTGRLVVYLHDGLARGIVNAAPRANANIDGRRFSGHMVTPVALPLSALEGALEAGDWSEADGRAAARDVAGAHLDMTPTEGGAGLVKGPQVYPAPDHIEERTQTWFVEVEPPAGDVFPRGEIGGGARFHARGPVRPFDAQGILDAIAAGLVPSAQLEIQLMALFARLGLPVESATQGDLVTHALKITSKTALRAFLDSRRDDGQRFVGAPGSAGQLRPVHSVFVEEGRAGGAPAGLAAQEMGFVLPTGRTLNTAVVLPVTDSAKGIIHAMVQVEHLPVPQRYESNGKVWRLPSFNLPAGVDTPAAARAFVAERMGVLPQMVVELGPPYYTHAGITPQRVFPFAVADPPKREQRQEEFFVPMHEISLLWSQLRDQNIMLAVARGYKMFAQEIRLAMKRQSVLARNAAREFAPNAAEYLPQADAALDLPDVLPALPEPDADGPAPGLAAAWGADADEGATPGPAAER